MSQYPKHLYTIEVSFGIDSPIFIQHFHDAEYAGMTLRSLKTKMYGSNGMIYSLKLFHKGSMISQYFAQASKPRWVHVPDADGITRIPPKTKGQMLMERPKEAKPEKPKKSKLLTTSKVKLRI